MSCIDISPYFPIGHAKLDAELAPKPLLPTWKSFLQHIIWGLIITLTCSMLTWGLVGHLTTEKWSPPQFIPCTAIGRSIFSRGGVNLVCDQKTLTNGKVIRPAFSMSVRLVRRPGSNHTVMPFDALGLNICCGHLVKAYGFAHLGCEAINDEYAIFTGDQRSGFEWGCWMTLKTLGTLAAIYAFAALFRCTDAASQSEGFTFKEVVGYGAILLGLCAILGLYLGLEIATAIEMVMMIVWGV